MTEEQFETLCEIFAEADAVWTANQAAYAECNMDEFQRLLVEYKRLAAKYRATRLMFEPRSIN